MHSDWLLSGLDFPSSARALQIVVNDVRLRRIGCGIKNFYLYGVIVFSKKLLYNKILINLERLSLAVINSYIHETL